MRWEWLQDNQDLLLEQLAAFPLAALFYLPQMLLVGVPPAHGFRPGPDVGHGGQRHMRHVQR